ncbi:MAG: hypothetical protein ACFBZ9_06410 [Sphingomonadales bacterium]
MSFFLYKPHVYGPAGVTTPDIIIDYLRTDEGKVISPQMLTSDTFLSAQGTMHVTPAYGKIAAGGGALIAPMLLLDDGRYVLPRLAWRIGHLPDQPICLSFRHASWALPGAKERITVRGHCEISLFAKKTCEVTLPSTVDIFLTQDGEKPLPLTLHIDACSKAPATQNARHSVGPTRKEVKHYI